MKQYLSRVLHHILYVDGGIFYGQKEDFVLVILSNGKAGRSDAIEKMQNLARYYAGTLQE